MSWVSQGKRFPEEKRYIISLCDPIRIVTEKYKNITQCMITANSNNLFYNETYSTVEIFDVQLNMYVVKRKLVIFFVTDVAAYRKRFA